MTPDFKNYPYAEYIWYYHLKDELVTSTLYTHWYFFLNIYKFEYVGYL